MKKNVIAYSLWGDMPIYWKGALKNIEQAKKYFPGWICRFYIDDTCKPELIETLKDCEIVMVKSKDSFEGMFWRFWAAADPEVNIFLSRDTDSRFSDREVAAINEWLDSDKDFHTMHDHPYHFFGTGPTPVLGGLWACRNGILRDLNIIEKINTWTKFSQKGCDQDFLGSEVYPLVKNKTLDHSEFGNSFGSETRPFPTVRKDYEYVGDIFDENDVRHPDYWKLIKRVIG